MRICTGCNVEKTATEFPKWSRGPGGLNYRCRVCVNSFRRKWHLENVETEKAKKTANRKRYRAEMVAAYGGKCVCCGESESSFLSIDHIHGGGRLERTVIRGPHALYKHLRDRGWPRDKYQLLCHNCNMSKGALGICAHVSRRIAA